MECQQEYYCTATLLSEEQTLSDKSERRLLETQNFRLGTWSYEHENKLKFKLDRYSIGITQVEEGILNITIEHPKLSFDDIQFNINQT